MALKSLLNINVIWVLVWVIILFILTLFLDKIVDGICLCNVQFGQFTTENNVSAEFDKIEHDFFLQISNNSELLDSQMACQKWIFNLSTWVIWVDGDSEGYLIGVIWLIDESIIQEESRIALFAIRIINLFTSWNIVASFNNKSLSFLIIIPKSLSRSSMIEHVCIWDEAICFYSFNCDTEDSTASHHSYFFVLIEGELGKVWNLFAD